MARDNRIDSLKGLLIILVILGHVITTLDNVNPLNHAVMGGIYVFHMPLFILISGYLTRRPDAQSPRDMWRSVVNILFTLGVFQLLGSIRIHLYGGDFVVAMERFPLGVLWYLLSLAYWKVILYYTPKSLLRRPLLYLSLALVISVLCGLTRLGGFLSLQRTLNFYIFFLLGYYCRQGMVNTRWWHNNVLHAAVAVVLLPLIFWLFPHCGNVMNGADHYSWSGIPEKALILCCSIAISILVFNLVRDNKVLRSIGKDSMFYFLYHSFFVDGVVGITIMRNDLPRTLPYVLLYTVAILAVLAVMSRIPFFRWFTKPILKREKHEDTGA